MWGCTCNICMAHTYYPAELWNQYLSPVIEIPGFCYYDNNTTLVTMEIDCIPDLKYIGCI